MHPRVLRDGKAVRAGPDGPLGRREFLQAGLTATTAIVAGRGLGWLPGIGVQRPQAGTEPTRGSREIRLIAEVGDVEVGPGRIYRTWLYNGRFPGPEIRVAEGEQLRIKVENLLPEGTTVHWHGVPVPNGMDGVPGVTQEPVPVGGSFVYEYVAQPSGTYLYHSHVGLQLDRGLVGHLVIEERRPHVVYDREYSLVLDDFLATAPDIAGRGDGPRERGMMRGMMGMMRRDDGRGMSNGMMTRDSARPAYAALLVNGRVPTDPPTLEVRRGERVRLRLLNPSGATIFRMAIAGHRMTVTHADGRPVDPITVDAVLLGPGERYDVLIHADNPGVWPLAAASLDGRPEPARAVLHYSDARPSRRSAAEMPEGLTRGRLLSLGDLIDLETRGEPSGSAERRFDLTLSGGMMSSAWTINGQVYPDADPLVIHSGERVRVRLTNMSMAPHPMHLHGHFFRVGRAVKDTVLVPPHMGRITFQFTADNPGDWLFHCHNLYHMEHGMARVFRYR